MNQKLLLLEATSRASLTRNLAEDVPSAQKVGGIQSLHCATTSSRAATYIFRNAMAAVQVSLPLPVLPQGWTEEKDFKPIGQLSSATQRNIEPVGPHFLAHARRVSYLPLNSGWH